MKDTQRACQGDTMIPDDDNMHGLLALNGYGPVRCARISLE
jgi:hypothetical protein